MSAQDGIEAHADAKEATAEEAADAVGRTGAAQGGADGGDAGRGDGARGEGSDACDKGRRRKKSKNKLGRHRGEQVNQRERQADGETEIDE